MTFRLFYGELERRREGRLLTCPTVLTAAEVDGVYQRPGYADKGAATLRRRELSKLTFPGYADTRFPEKHDMRTGSFLGEIVD